MGLSFHDIKKKVQKRIGKQTVKKIVEFVEQKGINLWGLNKPYDFCKISIYLTLYKDLKGMGSKKLKKKISNWYKPTDKTLMRNIQVLRELISVWAEDQIVLGTNVNWNLARDPSAFAKDLKKVNLWIDSSDFPLEGKRKIRKKSDEWIYKLNVPGRRFMVIMDGSTHIRACFGPYSPKLHDSSWLEANKKWVAGNLNKGVVVGDCHFSYGRKFKRAKFHIPYSELCKEYKNYIGYNRDIRKIRGLVESPFGIAKELFKALRKPFPGSAEQLGYLVLIAFGIHNSKLYNNEN